jgi:hypothetical protein
MIEPGRTITIPQEDWIGGVGPLTLLVTEVPDMTHPKLEWVAVAGRPVIGGETDAPVRVMVRVALLRKFGEFYLSGLLHCCGLAMWPVTRRAGRRYRCEVCGRGLDAIAAEVVVWDQAWRAQPLLGNGLTPYEQRHALLAAALSRVDVSRTGGSYQLSWPSSSA